MTPTERSRTLLKALIESFTDHPDSLTIEAKEMPGVVYWKVQAHADDTPFIIGKKGAHVKALKFVMTELGSARGTAYRLEILDPVAQERSEPRPPPRPGQYDPAPAGAFLRWILAELFPSPPTVKTVLAIETADRPVERPTFTFQMWPGDEEDYQRLTVPYEDDLQAQTLVGALGTLFRAYSRKQGTEFRIEVVEPVAAR